MDFELTQEQRLLQESADKFISNEYSFESRRELLSSMLGFSTEHWRRFADLGWLGVAFSEADGGYGGGAVDLMVLMQAMGKGLLLEPLQSSVVLAGGVLAQVASKAQKRQWLAGVMAGDVQLALAFAETQARYNVENVCTRADKTSSGYQINGEKIVVLNAPAADILLVTAQTSAAEGLSVFAIAADAQGVSRRDYSTVDGFRASHIVFEGVVVGRDSLLGREGGASDALAAAFDRARIALCSEAVGAMESLLWKTVEYLKTRKQFGAPLSSFQALQHRAVDMFIELEQARSMLFRAAMKWDEQAADASLSVSAAKARLGQAARLIGQEAVQLHGGMGVTDELDVGHYFKRLTVIEMLLGNTDYHLARCASALKTS